MTRPMTHRWPAGDSPDDSPNGAPSDLTAPQVELATAAADRETREQDRRGGGLAATLLRRFVPSDDSSSAGPPAGDTFLSARTMSQSYGIFRFDLENDALICADNSSTVRIWSTVRKLERRCGNFDIIGSSVTHP